MKTNITELRDELVTVSEFLCSDVFLLECMSRYIVTDDEIINMTLNRLRDYI